MNRYCFHKQIPLKSILLLLKEWVCIILHVDSQIAELTYVYCQNLHVDTTPITITSKYICKYSLYSENCYESQVVSGNPLALLGVKMV